MTQYNYPATTDRFRERLIASLFASRANGIRIRNLAFGPPASPEIFKQVEERLGFPVPPAMRSFFAAHDGASMLFHRVDDLAAEIDDRSVPLHVEDSTLLRWNDAMHDGGRIWTEIDAADFGRSEYGFFYVGMFCIPSLAEMFETDWRAIFGWPAGLVLFDAFHPFRASALAVDAATRSVRVQPTSDHGADRDAAQVELADYLHVLADRSGAERRIDGHYLPVRSHG